MKALDHGKSTVSQFDMSKLEVEYDYDTESEQIATSKTMLKTDLCDVSSGLLWMIPSTSFTIFRTEIADRLILAV